MLHFPKKWKSWDCDVCRAQELDNAIRGRRCLRESSLEEAPIEIQTGKETRLFSSRDDVYDFLRECELENPQEYDPVRILKNILGVCPVSFVTLQSQYLLSAVSFFTDEGGIRMLPYPALGYDNPALFFQSVSIVLPEIRKVSEAKMKAVNEHGSG